MKIRLADDTLLRDSIVDGEGIRTVIWTQGCAHNCPGCHNPETHDFNKGVLVDVEKVKEEIKNFDIQDGITLSGGDPFYQLEPCTYIAKYAKELGLNVWAYTGFLYEELIKNPEAKHMLKYIDVLIDGPFIMSKKSYECRFRGSTNQRVINVSKSLKENRTVLIKKYDAKPKKKLEHIMFI